jgi:hypothetical protein
MCGKATTLAAGALLVLFWWMAGIVSREHGTTADEIFHVTASKKEIIRLYGGKGWASFSPGSVYLSPRHSTP